MLTPDLVFCGSATFFLLTALYDFEFVIDQIQLMQV